MDKLNVHYYDGQWCDTDPYLAKVKGLPQGIKMEYIESLRKRLMCGQVHVSPIALANFNTIAATNTYDHSNNIFVYDLLYVMEEICASYDDCSDVLKIMAEQLEDMSSGLCSQGRTTRLFQIAFSFVKEELLC